MSHGAPPVWIILGCSFQIFEGATFIRPNNYTQVETSWECPQEGDGLRVPEMNGNPRTNAEDLVKMLDDAGEKVSSSTEKPVQSVMD